MKSKSAADWNRRQNHKVELLGKSCVDHLEVCCCMLIIWVLGAAAVVLVDCGLIEIGKSDLE
jgi:hypothetical protein